MSPTSTSWQRWRAKKMHELPKELTNSLRSFRGSIYGKNKAGEQDGAAMEKDLEKGETYEFDRALDGSESSTSAVCLFHFHQAQ